MILHKQTNKQTNNDNILYYYYYYYYYYSAYKDNKNDDDDARKGSPFKHFCDSWVKLQYWISCTQHPAKTNNIHVLFCIQ